MGTIMGLFGGIILIAIGSIPLLLIYGMYMSAKEQKEKRDHRDELQNEYHRQEIEKNNRE